MKIVLDARKYFDYGIGTYIQNLVPYICQRSDLTMILAPEDLDRVKVSESVHIVVDSSKKYSLRELWSIAKTANALNADIFHAPHYTLPYGLKIPSITTIHDVLHIRGRQYYSKVQSMYAKIIIEHACKISNAIIVDSIFTRNELCELCNVDENKVKVVYLGVSEVFEDKVLESKVEEFKQKKNIQYPAILYTGGLKPHKNVKILIQAFALLKQKKELHLLFAGESILKNPFLMEIIRKEGVSEQIIELGQLSKKELAIAYRVATVVVLPSLYEGFGLSMLEAMASGTPAVGARSASIPEVMGDGGILFDPHSKEELSHVLNSVLCNNDLRAKLIKNGYANVKRFTWDKCFEETFKIYSSIS